MCAPGPKERSRHPHKRLSQTCLGVFQCLLWRYGSAVVCHSDRALAAADLGGLACGISPFGGGHHQLHCRAAEQMTHKLENNYTKEVLALL